MERRLLLAIVLTFVVLTAYQWLVPTPQPAPATQTAAPDATVPDSAAASGHYSAAATSRPSTGPEPPAAVETVQADTAERTMTVDNGVVRAVFSNRGATLMAWELLSLYWAQTASPSIWFLTTFPESAEAVFTEARRRREDARG